MELTNKIFYSLMKSNLLVGAISGNYSVKDIQKWVETSDFEDTDRALLLYNQGENQELIKYLNTHKILVYTPESNFFNHECTHFNTHTGEVTLENSYTLVHNIRFLHLSILLENTEYRKIFTTDVKDVIFTRSPFESLPDQGLVATSEVIKYKEHAWNTEHLYTNLGVFGNLLFDEEVLNVGVWGGAQEDVKNLCRDIYLLSCGRFKVADQTSFNYLIRTSYKEKTKVTSLADNFAIHLHVVKEGKVPFNLEDLNKYAVIHQYDRFGDEILNYYTLPQ